MNEVITWTVVIIVCTPLVLLFINIIIGLDKERITKYLEDRGNTVLDIKWKLFGKGWMVESAKKNGGNRIYHVRYSDTDETIHHVWCKTALFGGVYVSDDEKIPPKRNLENDEKLLTMEELIRENKRLKEELENVKN